MCVLLLNNIKLFIGWVFVFVVVICFSLIVFVSGNWFDKGKVVDMGIIWFGKFLLLLLFIMVIMWIGVVVFKVLV